MGQSRPLFVYFRYFLDTISIIQIEKSIDGVLEIRTQGRRMVGPDETTELWRPPIPIICLQLVWIQTFVHTLLGTATIIIAIPTGIKIFF